MTATKKLRPTFDWEKGPTNFCNQKFVSYIEAPSRFKDEQTKYRWSVYKLSTKFSYYKSLLWAPKSFRSGKKLKLDNLFQKCDDFRRKITNINVFIPGIFVKNSWTANVLRTIEEAQDLGVKKDTEGTRTGTRTSDSKQVRENTKKMRSLKMY